MNFQKDVVVKIMKERKLVFDYIDSNVRIQDMMEGVIHRGKRQNDEEICKIFSKKFHSVFTMKDTLCGNIFSLRQETVMKNSCFTWNEARKITKHCIIVKANGPCVFV